MNKKGKIDRGEVARMLSVEAVARQYNITLPKNTNGVVKCPFADHDDSTPSFSMNLENGLWNCFGCDRKGDLFSFVAEMEGMDIVDDFVLVLEKSADIAGVTRDVSAQAKRGKKRRYQDEWDKEKDGDLTAARSVYIAKKKVDIAKLEIDIRPYGEKDFTIPVRDWRGEIIGLQRGSKMAVSESNVGGFFYENLDRKNTVYIVEGLSDYLSMLASGFKNVLGLFSVNVPEKEIKNVLSDAHDVKICLDYDHFDETGAARGSDAGFDKTRKILKTIPHIKAYFASYTEGLDISDIFMKRGAQAVAEIFEQPGKNYNDLEHDMDTKLIPSFDPRLIAESISEKELIATGEKEHWMFEEGVWTEVPKEKVEKMISTELVNRGAPKSIFKNIVEIRNFLRLETYTRMSKIKAAILQETLEEYIYFSDGKYDLKINKFSPYTPQDFVFSRLESKFTADSDFPKLFLKFLGQLFDGYKNPEKYISLIQEWMGYCLFPKSPIHAFLYVYGEGGNGKGVLFNIIGKIVGNSNILNYNVNKLETDGDRAIVQLFKKYVNLGTEERRGTNLGSPVLKSLTGGDPVTGRRLYREAFTFRPHAKMLFSSNFAPTGAEAAPNISRRLCLLHLKNIFDDGKSKRGDVELEQKILKEKEQIIWWSIQGLKRLLERGYFEKPEEMIAQEKKMLVGIDPIAAFVEKEKAFSLSNGKTISLMALYESFRIFYQEDLGKSSRYTPSRQFFIEGIEKQGFFVYRVAGVYYVGERALTVND